MANYDHNDTQEERIAQLERELAECKRQIESQHFAWCGCSQQLKDACADLDEVELQRDALANKIVQMREAIEHAVKKCGCGGVSVPEREALAIDTKSAEQVVKGIEARALRKAAERTENKLDFLGNEILVADDLRRMADELDGRVD